MEVTLIADGRELPPVLFGTHLPTLKDWAGLAVCEDWNRSADMHSSGSQTHVASTVCQ